jgi:FkbM family methyltransferase
MFSHSLARFSASLPSSIKYRLATIKPLYNSLLRLGQSRVQAQTIAGPLNWTIDELTSQQFLLGTYEPYTQEAFSKFVRKGATVYDVGAHAGYHSLLCALLVGSSGRIVAFEPNPKNRASIKRQLEANPQARVSISPYALSNLCETRALDTSHGSSEGHLSDKGDYIVEARRLDFVLANEGFLEPDVIKIDVEGHEENVLLGALETIARCQPVILCDRNDDTTFSRVNALLSPRGYLVTDGWPITAVHASENASPVDSRQQEGLALS